MQNNLQIEILLLAAPVFFVEKYAILSAFWDL
jgi:hypothetical protein